jgi:hypothetical protein
MNGIWRATIHVENHLNPGVPDLSYVINTSTREHETGWLELKALKHDQKIQKLKFTLEPSQHVWIQTHCPLVPVDLLVSFGDTCWLVPGLAHAQLNTALSFSDLNAISIVGFQKQAMRRVLAEHLSRLTFLGRNA